MITGWVRRWRWRRLRRRRVDRAQVLAVLARRPAGWQRFEVADELGWSLSRTAAILVDLELAGVVHSYWLPGPFPRARMYVHAPWPGRELVEDTMNEHE